MRASMPLVSAWIDEMRLAFGHGDVSGWVRDGLAAGTFHAKEAGAEIGTPQDYPGAISLAEITIKSPLGMK